MNYNYIIPHRTQQEIYNDRHDCTTCILDTYKNPPCNLPKYGPQQFGPYYDNDPNSVIKYRPKILECKPESCEQCSVYNCFNNSYLRRI